MSANPLRCRCGGDAKTVALDWPSTRIASNAAWGKVESSEFKQYSDETRASADQSDVRQGGVQEIVHAVVYLTSQSGKFSTGELLAEAVVYLTAPSGKYITGEPVNIDGGMVPRGEFRLTGMPDYFKPAASST